MLAVEDSSLSTAHRGPRASLPQVDSYNAALVCRDPPDLPPAPRARGRISISSTEAAVARDDAESLAAEPSSSPVKDDGALPREILIANPAFAAGAASGKAPDKEAAGAGQGNGAVGGSSGGPAPQGAAPEHAAPESEESSAAANGGLHGAATSNDVDPFAETDAALHSNAESEVRAHLPCPNNLLDILQNVSARII